MKCRDREDQKIILGEVLSNGLNIYLANVLGKKISELSKKRAQEKDNFANPHTLPSDFQNLFNGTTIYQLMNKKVGLEKTAFRKKIAKECFYQLELLELQGKFNRYPEAPSFDHDHDDHCHKRTDRMLDFSLDEIQKEGDLTNLFKIAKNLFQAPFQINKRDNSLFLQMCDRYLISYFPGKNDRINKIKDSGKNEGYDTGMKLTVLAIIGLEEKKSMMGKIKFQSNGKLIREESFQPNQCYLILSREVEYSISDVRTPIFMIKYLVSGP